MMARRLSAFRSGLQSFALTTSEDARNQLAMIWGVLPFYHKDLSAGRTEQDIGNSTMLDLKARPMLERDLDPLFKLEHMLKDVRHFLSEARALGIATPVAQRAADQYMRADSKGLGDRDFAAVIEIVEDPTRPDAPPPQLPIRKPRGFRP